MIDICTGKNELLSGWNMLIAKGLFGRRQSVAMAGIGQGVAIAWIFQSIPVLIYALLGALVWHLVVRPIEERDMIRRFGNVYLQYRQRVSCWIPTFRKTIP